MIKTSIKVGERRNATILFADMTGFTALSEKMDPEEIDALMNRVFGTFETIIKDNGGFVEKYIGDALVAVFGVPEIHEDDPVRALDSAIEFGRLGSSLLAGLPGDLPELKFRIGIHTGLITTGTRGDYDVVTGHAMAVAQRLQGAAVPGEVLVSDTVKEHCDSEYRFGEPQLLTVKGKKEPIQAWSLKGEVSGGGEESGVYIGRQEILDDILRLYIKDDNRVVTGRYIVSEPGMGKTRFVNALLERIRRFPDFQAPILKAKAQRYRSARYAVVSDIITEYLGLSVYEPPDSIRAALRGIRGMAEGPIDGFLRLLAMKEGDADDPDIVLSLFAIFQAIMEQYSNALYSCLVYIDNAQDLDGLSLEFFQYYLKNGRIKPFVLMAGREYPRRLREVFPDLKLVKLRPLNGDEARQLALALFPDCPTPLLDMIVNQGMGNPLFIKEYAQYARKNKDLNSLPDTIQNIFLTSLDRYEPANRDLIKKLSAYAHQFSADDARKVQEATNSPATIVDKALRRFVEDGILARNGNFYSFSQDIFRKSLYASLLNHNKRIIHGAIADIMLMGQKPHRLRLILHLLRAERWAEAATIMLNDTARTYTYEYLAHIDLLYRNLSKAAPDEAIQLLILRASLFFNAGRVDEAEQELKRIMQAALAQEDAACMGFAYHLICAINTMSYSFQKVRFTGQKALQYSRRAQHPSRAIQGISHYLALAEMHRNNFAEAWTIIEDTKQLAEFDNFQYGQTLSEYYLLSGDYQQAMRTIDGNATPSDKNYQPVATFYGLNLRLKVLWQLCDYKALGPAAKRLLDAGELSRSSISQAHAMLAVCQHLAADHKSAGESFSQAEFHTEQIRNDFDRLDALRTLSQCLLLADDANKAEKFALEALALGLRHSCFYPTFTVCLSLVRTMVAKGDLEAARFYLQEAAWFFTTGLLLPYKDVILYYYYAGSLGSADNAARNRQIAKNLIDDELGRLKQPELINNFLTVRGYGEIQHALEQLEDNHEPA
ncbi:MAG: hypothetical protein A2087_11485 [Spirochaetes bacterium GWD1_61_31]|nr:MAG: hypothetical protein A2Y37_14715 [Spirochaetes bacterium GWB1_60_80]OHD29315.1 MAG: hypothetical protein A2004_08215 [Spirochaetes bacterium GWC1_61_12]OHD35823.1 MAG: hypothetical protein A2087_11485 [Spirochaetes bacterium GWD1_61_31]OHD46764.1 MAG: hypothetical protein A2Y35_10655 [Spirochaetes bacterium GWE1_60_18]OHD61216.1 MAG: hypothetical protein A2Y32_12950 [Spirochaetes bacterium GWF1_60_12]HAP43026.1 hypothetical protein [Spirochaetaceae bacterium]